MIPFKIEIHDGGVTAALRQMGERAANPAPALKAIGEALLVQTKRTFETSTDPWGRRWRPNAPATFVAMLTRKGSTGNFRARDGKLSGKGAGRVMAKKPLIGESRFLSGTSLHYRVSGGELTLASSAIYAAIHHLGGQAGRGKKVAIPARPFFPATPGDGIAPEAQRSITGIIQEYLLGQP